MAVSPVWAGGGPAAKATSNSLARAEARKVLTLRRQVGQLVVFGDSLSDYGNNGIATNAAAPGQPSGTWAMQLARTLGQDLTLARRGGTNYAQCWATSSGLKEQVDAFLESGLLKGAGDAPSQEAQGRGTNATRSHPPPLFAVWIGGNDLLARRTQEDALAAVEEGRRQIERLYTAGGRRFLWANMPDLGQAPVVAALPDAASATQAARWYNQYWLEAVRDLRSSCPDMVLIPLDAAGLFERLARNPARFGLKNVRYGCAGVPGARPEEYLFWDGLHPTTRGHELMAQLAMARLQDALANAEKANRPAP